MKIPASSLDTVMIMQEKISKTLPYFLNRFKCQNVHLKQNKSSTRSDWEFTDDSIANSLTGRREFIKVHRLLLDARWPRNAVFKKV